MSTVLDNSLEMGSSCSSQLAAEKEKNKQLEGRVKFYEAGITDSSVHASQTNIGLLNVATEENSSGCDCSSTSLWGVLEVLAMCVCLVYVYWIHLPGELLHKKEGGKGKAVQKTG